MGVGDGAAGQRLDETIKHPSASHEKREENMIAEFMSRNQEVNAQITKRKSGVRARSASQVAEDGFR